MKFGFILLTIPVILATFICEDSSVDKRCVEKVNILNKQDFTVEIHHHHSGKPLTVAEEPLNLLQVEEDTNVQSREPVIQDLKNPQLIHVQEVCTSETIKVNTDEDNTKNILESEARAIKMSTYTIEKSNIFAQISSENSLQSKEVVRENEEQEAKIVEIKKLDLIKDLSNQEANATNEQLNQGKREGEIYQDSTLYYGDTNQYESVDSSESTTEEVHLPETSSPHTSTIYIAEGTGKTSAEAEWHLENHTISSAVVNSKNIKSVSEKSTSFSKLLEQYAMIKSDLIEHSKKATLLNTEYTDKYNKKPDKEITELLTNSSSSTLLLLDNPIVALLQSNRQRPSRIAENQIPSPVLEFPDVPEGESFHVQELGLSEGIFVFSYLSSFLSWIQPYDFPVELLRDALWSRVSVIDLITQSLQVEVGFIVCITVGVLLALGVPVILLTHACCRLLDSNKRNSNWNEDSASETANNCAVNFRRCTLVFVMQLILMLLVAGIVSMFVTNEQMSRAVDQTPSVVHTALNDVTTFLRNSHQQLRFVITKSLDQAVDAVNTDLDNVEELLGRPIQDELAEETGVDVALDALVDVSAEARIMSGKVEDLMTSCSEARALIMECRERLADLRMQVDTFRQQCPSRSRPLCDTVNAAGLDVVLRLDSLMSEERLAQIRYLREGNLSLVTQQARGEFQFIPLRVEKDTRDARNGVKRQLTRQKEILYDSIWSLDVVTRDLTYKIENIRSQALQMVRGVSTIEQWRWLTGLGAALSVLFIWLLLLSGISCGCCGAKERAAPTLLASVVFMCIFSVALWAVALGALLVGGHGEVFVCRPLYDEPGYNALTRLVDRPGVLYQRGGGFFSNLLYGNGTMDVPLRDVLQKCQDNGATYSAFKLKQVFDVDSASNHNQWDMLHKELSQLKVNLNDMQLLTPELQNQLQSLLHATTVNLTYYRSQMTGQVTGKDLSSFADQMTSVANQITDWPTLDRLEKLTNTTRRLLSNHIQPLEQKKEDLVYQLTALEMQLAPLQRQVNQSLFHLRTIQYFINNQGGNIANQKSVEYTTRLVNYMDQYRFHVMNKTQNHVAPCRPIWNLYHAMRLLFCRHIMDPLNGFWFATVWCLLLFMAATPPCLKLMDHYKQLRQNSGLLHTRSSESPSETMMIQEQGAIWTTPGVPEPDGW